MKKIEKLATALDCFVSCPLSYHVLTKSSTSLKFLGPYRMVTRVGAVAYGLDLPESSRIHPVGHVMCHS